MDTKQWAGIPWEKRYSQWASAPSSLVKKMREIDDLLDLKFYMPTGCWHVVRYLGSRPGAFVRCWECNDSPGKSRDLGMWIIDALHKGDLWNNPIIEEIDKSNERLEKSIDNTKEDHCRELSKDMLKPLQDLHDYGPNAETNRHFTVGEPKLEKKEGFTIRDKRCTSTNL